VLLVVGGALTGLSSGMFLAAHGVPCVVIVERHPDLLIHPLGCARHQPARTVELFRQVRLEPAILAASYVSSAIGTPSRPSAPRP
jgi:putative polyketide hydroxylase